MSHAELKTWPAMTVAEAYSTLTAPGTPFEMETLRIGDRTVRAYKHGFPHLRAVFEHGLGWGSREYLVFESERLTFDAHGRAVAALARVLHSNYGVRKGDRIAIAMRNFPEWSIAFWAGSVLGAVVTPLAEDEIPALIEAIRAADLRTLAVSFLFSFLNDVHERRVGAALRHALPDVQIYLSCEVLPEIREFERGSTTIAP